MYEGGGGALRSGRVGVSEEAAEALSQLSNTESEAAVAQFEAALRVELRRFAADPCSLVLPFGVVLRLRLVLPPRPHRSPRPAADPTSP